MPVHPIEFRQRALRLLVEAIPEADSEFAAIKHAVAKLGIAAETAEPRL